MKAWKLYGINDLRFEETGMPSPGEELWDIAKAHGTTMEQILQANELEEEALPAGRMLLIPSAR